MLFKIYCFMRKETKNWWEQAKADIKSAEHCLISKDYYLAAFMCQQAVEKGLKALYLEKYNELRRIHDLVLLAQNVLAPDNVIDLCIRLNRIYVETRYPDASGKIPAEKFSHVEAKNILKISHEVLQWLEKNL